MMLKLTTRHGSTMYLDEGQQIIMRDRGMSPTALAGDFGWWKYQPLTRQPDTTREFVITVVIGGHDDLRFFYLTEVEEVESC